MGREDRQNLEEGSVKISQCALCKLYDVKVVDRKMLVNASCEYYGKPPIKYLLNNAECPKIKE